MAVSVDAYFEGKTELLKWLNDAYKIAGKSA